MAAMFFPGAAFAGVSTMVVVTETIRFAASLAHSRARSVA
jgi:hypothetical protein